MNDKDKQWTIYDLEIHINTNVKSYGGMIVVAVLFKKIYGTFPSNIGLSGFQVELAENILKIMPESEFKPINIDV